LRVDEVRKALEMTQAVFADSIGMTQSGYATLIKREGPTQRKGKGLKTLALAIEAAHGIRHQWILTGDEPRTVQYQKWLHYVEWKRRGLNDSDL
jgi:DNA-binding XRE family transcriptional regulator